MARTTILSIRARAMNLCLFAPFAACLVLTHVAGGAAEERVQPLVVGSDGTGYPLGVHHQNGHVA